MKGKLRSWPLRGLWSRSKARPASADASADSRRSDGSPTGRKGDLLARLALITALTIAALSAAGGILLVQQTAAHRHALLLMSQVEERIGQEHVIKRQAILDPRRGQDLVARLRETRQQLTLELEMLARDERRIGAFDRILRLNAGPTASARVLAAVQVQQVAVDEAFALVLAGRLDQARAVAPRAGLEEVSQATGLAAGAYAGVLERTHRALAGAVVAFAVVGGAAVGWLGFRVLRLGRAYRRLSGGRAGASGERGAIPVAGAARRRRDPRGGGGRHRPARQSRHPGGPRV